MKNIPVSALIGLFFTALYFLGAIFAPLLAPYGMAEVVGDVWEPSSADYWLGTDNIGRDLLSRMIYGGRTTIFIATMATVISFTTGAILGIFAAVSGGWVDQLLSRFVDLIMSIPTLIFALVVLSVTPVTVPMLILVMGLLDSTRVFRLARAVAVDRAALDDPTRFESRETLTLGDSTRDRVVVLPRRILAPPCVEAEVDETLFR